MVSLRVAASLYYLVHLVWVRVKVRDRVRHMARLRINTHTLSLSVPPSPQGS